MVICEVLDNFLGGEIIDGIVVNEKDFEVVSGDVGVVEVVEILDVFEDFKE